MISQKSVKAAHFADVSTRKLPKSDYKFLSVAKGTLLPQQSTLFYVVLGTNFRSDFKDVSNMVLTKKKEDKAKLQRASDLRSQRFYVDAKAARLGTTRTLGRLNESVAAANDFEKGENRDKTKSLESRKSTRYTRRSRATQHS
jgi:flagellar basal body L-ring protein FlgH